ncbi:hypothetical protein ACYOEI_21000 [Singulisphaera rosea]
MKKTTLLALTIASAAWLGSSSGAKAQGVITYSSWYAAPASPWGLSYAPVVTTYSAATPVWTSPPYLPVGQGYNDFPYFGRPYGSPNDPWTWPFMSDTYQRSLARYYYPPVR